MFLKLIILYSNFIYIIYNIIEYQNLLNNFPENSIYISQFLLLCITRVIFYFFFTYILLFCKNYKSIYLLYFMYLSVFFIKAGSLMIVYLYYVFSPPVHDFLIYNPQLIQEYAGNMSIQDLNVKIEEIKDTDNLKFFISFLCVSIILIVINLD